MVAAYLLATGLARSVDEAVGRVRAVTPQTLLDSAWIERLREFEAGMPRAQERHA